MTIEKKIENGKLTVSLFGKLNTITSPQLDEELSDLNGISELILDFAGLESITSAGLRVLLTAQCTMDEQGKMTVIHVNDSIHEIFVLTGFVNFLTIV